MEVQGREKTERGREGGSSPLHTSIYSFVPLLIKST